MSRFPAFLGLYRLDVAFITFCAALAGDYFSYGFFTGGDVGRALFVALVLYHYVYALNALTDRAEDAVNHPERPLPSGRFSIPAAVVSVALLALVAVGGSLVLFSGRSLFLALLVVFFGTLYSVGPFAFKRFPFAAALVTGWGIMHPFFITADPAVGWRGFAFILIATGAVLFKDLADEPGDRLVGRHPLTAVFPVPLLCGVALVFFVAGTFFLWWVEWWVALPIPMVLAGILVAHWLFMPLASWRGVIYTRLIRGALAAIALAALAVVGGMFSW